MQKKTLKFENKLVEPILSGKKNCTWRLFDDKNLSVGDGLVFVNRDTLKEFAEAKIISIIEKELKNVDDFDFDGHESFGSKEEMIETYKGYYGDKVSEDSLVKIIKFRLIK